MANVREKKSVGPSGFADVRILKSGARVSFEDGTVFDIQSYPDILKTSGKYIVTLSQDKSKIVGVRPQAGQYVLQFKQMGNRTVGRTAGSNTPGLPANKIQRGGPRKKKDGKGMWVAPDQLVFIAEFEVVQGPYEGFVVSTNVPYSFVAPVSGNVTDYSDSKRNLENLEIFLRCSTGIPLTNIDIEYSDDSTQLLLRYEKFILSHRVPFLGHTTENGFADLNSFSSLPPELLPSKKSVKKAKK